MFSSLRSMDSTRGADTMAKAAKWVRVQFKICSVAGGHPEVWPEQPNRPTWSMSGYAQQPGLDTGFVQSWNRIVVCRLLYHVPIPLLLSPLVL